jgi:hypothetical protein
MTASGIGITMLKEGSAPPRWPARRSRCTIAAR